jgi:hypothetical protein
VLAGDRQGGAERVLGLGWIRIWQPSGKLAAQSVNFCVPAPRGRFCQCVVQGGKALLYFSGERQRLGQQGEEQRCVDAGAGRLECGQTVADAGNSRRRFIPLGVDPALKNLTIGRPLGKPVFTRERQAILAAGAGGATSRAKTAATPA